MLFILANDVNINDLNIQKLTNCAHYPRLVIIYSHLINFELNNMCSSHSCKYRILSILNHKFNQANINYLYLNSSVLTT